MISKPVLVFSAVVTLLAAASPSYAIDFDSLVNTILGGTSASTSATITNDQVQVKQAIATRQAQLEQQIESGAKSGLLTAEEQAELRNDLNHSEFIEGTYLADANLSPTEVRTLVDELSRISRKLNVYLTNKSSTGYAETPKGSKIRGNRYGYWMNRYGGRDEARRNSQAVQAMIDARQAELESAISRGVMDGTISASNATAFRKSLGSIARWEAQFQIDGVITLSEQEKLTKFLDDLDARIRTSRIPVATRPHSGSTMSYRNYLRQRIEAGVRSGRLTRREADDLFAKERETARLETSLRQSGMNLSYQEERYIMARLDKLSAQIDKELNDHQIW